MTNDEQLDALFKKYFRHQTPNPNQKEIILEIVKLLERGVKHIILESPTGTGKSDIAVTAARIYNEASKYNVTTTYITVTKNLQDQLVSDFRDIANLKSKSNYTCPCMPQGFNAYLLEKLRKEGKCNPDTDCPYYIARAAWRASRLRLTNAAFQIAACNDISPKNPTNLMILDECHNLERIIVDQSTLTISVPVISELFSKNNQTFKHIMEFLKLLDEHDHETPFDIDSKRSGIASTIIKGVQDKYDFIVEQIKEETDEAEIKSLSKIAGSLSDLSDRFTYLTVLGSSWIVEEHTPKARTVLVPLYASQMSYKALWRKSDQFIHMSATICGADKYIESLGIDPDESVYLSVPNPIPVDNRPVYAMNVANMNAKKYELDKLCNYIDKVIEREDGYNGIIHTVSFKLANEIFQKSKYRQNMIVSNDHREILQWLRSGVDEHKQRIVVSPSIEEGYDFPGDLSRFQIIAKIPYGYLGSRWIKLRSSADRKWYTRNTILRLVQAAGRSVRGIDDYARTYVLDSGFEKLYAWNGEFFPEWYSGAVIHFN